MQLMIVMLFLLIFLLAYANFLIHAKHQKVKLNQIAKTLKEIKEILSDEKKE
ncbi:hypothetical protein IEO70_12950 [Bacillus sp. AGMB 02131]|uniref:Uncharacterized protein n=1 Tax=Peribacillus faecalis TaxID=2772559 RepID=A0A927D0D4_9BACI|nr:hypothetical protein [Peribacillus faecalis]MBD3109255.1 hypothetical protein [Peribacillus faecalis]